ncbi:unnamed protein product [Arctogadus glacialis]
MTLSKGIVHRSLLAPWKNATRLGTQSGRVMQAKHSESERILVAGLLGSGVKRQPNLVSQETPGPPLTKRVLRVAAIDRCVAPGLGGSRAEGPRLREAHSQRGVNEPRPSLAEITQHAAGEDSCPPDGTSDLIGPPPSDPRAPLSPRGPPLPQGPRHAPAPECMDPAGLGFSGPLKGGGLGPRPQAPILLQQVIYELANRAPSHNTTLRVFWRTPKDTAMLRNRPISGSSRL